MKRKFYFISIFCMFLLFSCEQLSQGEKSQFEISLPQNVLESLCDKKVINGRTVFDEDASIFVDITVSGDKNFNISSKKDVALLKDGLYVEPILLGGFSPNDEISILVEVYNEKVAFSNMVFCKMSSGCQNLDFDFQRTFYIKGKDGVLTTNSSGFSFDDQLKIFGGTKLSPLSNESNGDGSSISAYVDAINDLIENGEMEDKCILYVDGYVFEKCNHLAVQSSLSLLPYSENACIDADFEDEFLFVLDQAERSSSISLGTNSDKKVLTIKSHTKNFFDSNLTVRQGKNVILQKG